MYHTK